MQHLNVRLLLSLLLFTITSPPARAQQEMDEPLPLRVYAVDKRVSDLPVAEDFSRPELAYASIHRRLVNGDANWQAMSVARLGPVLPKSSGKSAALGERAARGYLEARIVEVRMISESIAYVIAQWPTSGSYDARCMEVEEGRWLNAGEEQANTLEAARQIAENAASVRRENALNRKRALHPQDYLVPFVEFAKKSSTDPRGFLLDNLATHRLTMFGEIRHRPAYWKLLSDTVEDSRFAEHVGVIFLQLPENNQALVDKFLDAASLDPAPIVELMHQVDWMGNPDASLLDFFTSVWRTNQPLARERRVRIVLVDSPMPWKVILTPADLRAYDIAHDTQIAHAILRHFVFNPGDTRNTLCILDAAQACKNLRWRADDSPMRTAGWRLSEVLGTQCFSVMEHSPQITDHGTVIGRVGEGLFDSAFREAGDKPMAVMLHGSPFGAEAYDASAELDCAGSYQDAFDALIVLERLEDEHHSPALADFYTEDFVKETDRRHVLIYDRQITDELGSDEISAERFMKWLDRTWGQPRGWKQNLGPIDAWRIGNDAPMFP